MFYSNGIEKERERERKWNKMYDRFVSFRCGWDERWQKKQVKCQKYNEIERSKWQTVEN